MTDSNELNEKLMELENEVQNLVQAGKNLKETLSQLELVVGKATKSEEPPPGRQDLRSLYWAWAGSVRHVRHTEGDR